MNKYNLHDVLVNKHTGEKCFISAIEEKIFYHTDKIVNYYTLFSFNTKREMMFPFRVEQLNEHYLLDTPAIRVLYGK